MSDTPVPVFDGESAEVIAWLAGAQAIIDAHWAAQGYTHEEAPALAITVTGSRYLKVSSMRDGGKGRAEGPYAFIDRASGDILKAAGADRPAPHARGNLLDEQGGTGSLGPYGPAYLR